MDCTRRTSWFEISYIESNAVFHIFNDVLLSGISQRHTRIIRNRGWVNTEIVSRLTRARIRDACWVNKKKVSRFERSRRNENTRRGTIIARVASFLPGLIEAWSWTRSKIGDRSFGQFRPDGHCTKNTTHVLQTPFKNQFRKIILIGLSLKERKRECDKKRTWETKRLERWTIKTSHYIIAHIYTSIYN